MNSNLSKSLAKGVFYLVVITLFVWTSTLTYQFVRNVLPHMPFYVPAFALVVFDVGMMAWMYVFIHYAQGYTQRGVSIALTIFDLIGVGIMSFSEILLGGQNLAEIPASLGTYAIWAIGVWTFTNVAAAVAFHLGDPEAQKSMSIQSEKDAIFAESLKKLTEKRAAISGHVADKLSGNMLQELLAELAVDRNGDGIPDVFQRKETVEMPTTAPKIAAVAAEVKPPQTAVIETKPDTPEQEAVNFTQPNPQ